MVNETRFAVELFVIVQIEFESDPAAGSVSVVPGKPIVNFPLPVVAEQPAVVPVAQMQNPVELSENVALMRMPAMSFPVVENVFVETVYCCPIFVATLKTVEPNDNPAPRHTTARRHKPLKMNAFMMSCGPPTATSSRYTTAHIRLM